jgi:hypothetical protein
MTRDIKAIQFEVKRLDKKNGPKKVPVSRVCP